MRSKLALSAAVVASLFGATAIASAQTQPAPGASSSGNVGPGATSEKNPDTMTPKTGAGMNKGTTGAGKGNAGGDSSSSGNVGPGTSNNQGKSPAR
jgi:hypothetical protein